MLENLKVAIRANPEAAKAVGTAVGVFVGITVATTVLYLNRDIDVIPIDIIEEVVETAITTK